MALRAAVDAAGTRTDEQKKQSLDLRQAMSKLTREYRARVLEIVTDVQKAKLDSLRK